MSADSERRIGWIFLVAAYAIPGGTLLLAAEAYDFLWERFVVVSFIIGPVCGLIAYILGMRVANATIKLFGGLALAFGSIALLLFLYYPVPGP